MDHSVKNQKNHPDDLIIGDFNRASNIAQRLAQLLALARVHVWMMLAALLVISALIAVPVLLVIGSFNHSAPGTETARTTGTLKSSAGDTPKPPSAPLVPPTCAAACESDVKTVTSDTTSNLFGWDDFQRLDGPLFGSRTPSGQTYINTFSTAQAVIRDGRFVTSNPNGTGPGPAGVPESAAIAARLSEVPTSIAASFVMRQPGSLGADAVLAASKINLVPAIQLAVYGPLGTLQANTWLLFYTEYDTKTGKVIYPAIARGSLATSIIADGATDYRMGILNVNVAAGTAIVLLPDGTHHAVRDPSITKYWGSVITLQTRGNRSGGLQADFTGWAAGSGVH